MFLVPDLIKLGSRNAVEIKLVSIILTDDHCGTKIYFIADKSFA
jgi:hypothetical protein